MSEEKQILNHKLTDDQAEMLPFAELFFFAYRDFISDPDTLLKNYGFGRAHHRVLHFVSRNPGLMVSELLDILKVTKQSLARILKQLIDEGFIEQKMSSEDKRARFLYATPKGLNLIKDLISPQLDRLMTALSQASPEKRAHIQDFFLDMISVAERDTVSSRIFNKP